MRLLLLALSLLFVTAPNSTTSIQTVSVEVPDGVAHHAESDLKSKSKPQLSTEPVSDPYAEHDNWCEDLYKMACECPDRDPIICAKPKEACPLDRTGTEQQCVRPKWARREGSNVYQCVPKWLNRSQQKVRRESLQVIVGEICEWPWWAHDLAEWGAANRMGDDPSRLCWRLKGGTKALKQCKSKHWCQPDKLHKLLALVASRESTWQNQTTHELNKDVEANQRAFAKAQKRGWYEDNPHFLNPDRWQRGYGWYGHNAALKVALWDKDAPPEILCRQVESTEVYLRNARDSFRKLWNKYGDSVERVYVVQSPNPGGADEKVKVKGVTWYDVHRAASSGKLSPEKVIKTRAWSKRRKKWMKVGFVIRARSRKVQLDPFETVMWEMLGEQIPVDRQNEVADKIREQVREHFMPESQASINPGDVATF